MIIYHYFFDGLGWKMAGRKQLVRFLGKRFIIQCITAPLVVGKAFYNTYKIYHQRINVALNIIHKNGF